MRWRSAVQKPIPMKIATRIYHSKAYSTLQRVGLDRPVAALYWSMKTTLRGDTVQRSVGEATARFHTETRAEHSRFRDETFRGELETIEVMVDVTHEDDVFYDIGANVGLHACLLGSIVDGGDVVAVEPHAKSVERLEENLELNEIDAHVCSCAFSDVNDTAVLELEDDTPGAVGSVSRGSSATEGRQEIELRRGDEVIRDRELPDPDVIKIDVDGGELGVLKGLSETLSDGSCQHVFCEIHPGALPEYGASEEEVLSEFEVHGLETERIELDHAGREGAYFVHAER